MSPHRALLLDADEDFLALLKQSLEPCGVSVVQIRVCEDTPLGELLAEPPDLILISVELPDKEGFGLFTRVRSLAKRVPIAMATSSLSATEMSLHAKLRLHADLYLNKRALDPELLLRTLQPLLPDVPGLAAQSSRHVPMRSLPDGTGSIPEWLSDPPEEGEMQALFAGFPDDALREGGGIPSDASDAETARRIARLEAERDQLRRELAEARRDASSSPFSVEAVSQREEIQRSAAELSRLQFEVGHRDRELAEARQELALQAEELEVALREKSDALVRLMQFEEQLEDAGSEIQRLEEQRRALEEAQASDRARAQQEFAEQRERDTEALFQTQLKLAELHSALRETKETAEGAQRIHEDELAELRAGKERAIAKLEKRWGERLELAQREHEAALQTAREKHADELRVLETSQREALARTERGLEAEKSRALEEQKAEAEARLEKVQRAHAEELEARAERGAQELEKLEAGHREALARLDRERKSAISHALTQQKAADDEKLGELERVHAKQLAGLRQHYAEEQQSLEAEKSRALEEQKVEAEARLEKVERVHAKQLAGLRQHCAEEQQSLEAEQSCALEEQKVEAEARLEKVERVHAKQLAGLRQRYAEEQQSLEAEHAARMSRKEAEFEAALSQAVGDSQAEFPRQLEEARREQEETIASLQRYHVEERHTLEQEREAAHKAQRAAETRLAELQRVGEGRRGDLEALERELADRDESIASLKALVEDLQRGMALGPAGNPSERSGTNPAEPERGGTKP
jgi:CheY-like chemotaxis protein